MNSTYQSKILDTYIEAMTAYTQASQDETKAKLEVIRTRKLFLMAKEDLRNMEQEMLNQ